MKTEVLLVTPSMAEKWLGNNTQNRKVNLGRVSFYAKAMSESKWELNGESLKFDSEGILIDGQHRLLAIIKAGVSIKTFIIQGLPSDVFKTIDTGRPRSGSDTLKINHVDNSLAISTGINRYMNLTRGFNNFRKNSNSDILEEYNNRPDYYQNLLSRGVKFYNVNHRILSPSDYVGFYAWFHARYSEERIDGFFHNIENSVGVCGLLNNKLLDDVISKRKMNKIEKAALIIKAFLYYLNGKPIKLLKFSVDEPFPELPPTLTELMTTK